MAVKQDPKKIHDRERGRGGKIKKNQFLRQLESSDA